jgi:tetratricopeptide (TPR) repeat protein
MKVLKPIIFSILLACYIAPLVLAEENPLLEEGIALYRQEDYDEALSALKKVREEDPTSTLAAYYLGLTYKQIQDYKHAKPHLEAAVTHTPKIKGALLELVEVLYQLKEMEEARHYIGVAEKEGIKPAQTAFLKGLVLLKEGRNLEAVEAFEEAKALDKSLVQTADYQIGMAYLKEKRFKEAKETFKEVVIIDPNSDIALFASRYMETLLKKEEEEKPFKFSLGLAYQYDDNVILRPSGIAVAGIIADESDTREVTTFTSEYTKRFTDKLRLKLNYSLYWANQDDLNEYDVLSNNTTVTPSYYFEKASLSVPIGYNYTMVGGHDYLSSLSVNPLFNLMVGNSYMGQLFFKYQNKNFLKSAANANEKRDSNYYGGGAGLFLFFADNKGFLNLRYELNKDDAEGRNWEYVGNKFTATLLVPLFERLKVSASGEAFLQDFENTHTVFGEERDDEMYTASCMLTYDLFKDTEIQLRYTYVKNDSNIGVYDYDRSIYSGGVGYKF